MRIAFTILGEPASKANSRELVTRGAKVAIVDGKRARVGGRPMFIKSEKARNYEADALRQIPPAARIAMPGPVRITLRIWYATERPDLDESVILDVLQNRYVKDKNTGVRQLVQKGVYVNDRQVREKHVYWGKDPANPRAEIEVEPIDGPLFAAAPTLFADAQA